MEVEFLAVGDLHLNGINNLFPNYNFNPDTLIYRSLKKPLNYASENSIKYIILLGDIFDNPFPDQIIQRTFLQFLINNKQFEFYMIPGNHDYENIDTISLDMPDFTTKISKELKHVHFMVTPTLLEIEGVPFSFLPWPHCKTLQNPSINIAHIELAGFKSDNGKIFDKGYKISPSGCWYIGHLHRYQEPYYPGTLFQKTFGDTDTNKGFYHCYAKYKNGKLICKHERIPIKPVYTLKTLKIIDKQDLRLVKPPEERAIVQYRLLLRNNVELPIGYLEDNPHVIDVTGKLTKKEMNELEKQNFSIDLADTEVDLLDGLDEFLANDGLTEQQIKKALKKSVKYINDIKANKPELII